MRGTVGRSVLDSTPTPRGRFVSTHDSHWSGRIAIRDRIDPGPWEPNDFDQTSLTRLFRHELQRVTAIFSCIDGRRRIALTSQRQALLWRARVSLHQPTADP